MSSEHANEKAVDPQGLLKIQSNIQFLGSQALPLKGEKHNEVNSNFNQLLYLRGEDNP